MTASIDTQVAARLGSAVRAANRRRLTVDTTVRAFVLTPGGWRLFGSSTATYYTVRRATDAAGTLASSEVAPTTAYLAAPSAGSPGAGLAWPASGTDPTAPLLPSFGEDYREIAVRGGEFAVLYVRCASGSTTVDLEGPFESPV
jgi:hypothetical protein